jgi:hypothetical protein
MYNVDLFDQFKRERRRMNPKTAFVWTLNKIAIRLIFSLASNAFKQELKEETLYLTGKFGILNETLDLIKK